MKKDDKKIIVILNKPQNYVCALKDNLHPTVLDLIHEDIKDLHIVGRLDKDTTGILILTNDGQYTHNATHPKKHVKKVYQITLKNDFSLEDKNEIEKGMKIDYGQTQLKPGFVEIVNSKEILLTIFEGKFHQVKKMMFALNNEVLSLHRVEFDTFSLDDFNLKIGDYKVMIKD